MLAADALGGDRAAAHASATVQARCTWTVTSAPLGSSDSDAMTTIIANTIETTRTSAVQDLPR